MPCRILLLLLLFIPQAQAATALWMKLVPPSGAPVSVRTWAEPADSFAILGQTSGSLAVAFSGGPGADAVSLFVDAPRSGNFSVGPYEAAEDFFNSTGPAPVIGLLSGTGEPICRVAHARYVILQRVVDANSNITAFALDFEMECGGGSVVWGELRIQSAIPLTVDKPATNTTPDAFAFAPVQGVGPGVTVVSAQTTIYGIGGPAPISIAGGEYSVNGAPYTATGSQVNNEDHVTVRAVSSSAFGTTKTATLTVGGTAATFDVTTYTPGVPFTAASFHQGPAGSFKGQDLEARSPEWRITGGGAAGVIGFNVFGPNDAFYTIEMSPPAGQRQLAPGAYEEVLDRFDAPGGLSLNGSDGLGNSLCGRGGRFVVHEIEADASNITKFAASFKALCTGRPPAFGEIRFNSTIPLPSMITAPVSTPYPFALMAQSPVAAGSIVRSNVIGIDGTTQPVPVSITGGRYSINGSAFTDLPGTADPHDEIRVQLTASTTPGAVTAATLTAGGQSATLSVTTYSPGMALSGLYFRSTAGAPVGGELTRLYLAPPNRLSSSLDASVQDTMRTVLASRDGRLWQLALSANVAGRFSEGVYDVLPGPDFLLGQPGINFNGDFEICRQAAGHFVVREAVIDPVLRSPQHFAADFELHCAGLASPPVFGELRINSAIPFSALAGGACAGAPDACAPDLSLLQALANAPVVGNEATLTLTASNAGTATAHNVTVTDVLPPGLEFVRGSSGCVHASGTVVCTAAAVPNESSASFDIVVRPKASGTMTNVATVSSQETAPTATGNTSSATITVQPRARLSNIATRGQVSVGENVLIGGFVIGGATPKTVVVTAIGPALTAAGIANALPDPVLTLFRSSDGSVLATNDDWSTAPNASAIQAAGFAPGQPRESAIMMTLQPGAYTAIVSGAGNTAGVGIVAVYEVDHPEVPLLNISTRGRVLTGNDVMIGGFVIQGAADRTVVVTAIGPALLGAGIPDALANPTLTLFAADGTMVATNDDWGTAPNAAQIQGAGFAPADPRESAIMVTLPPGAYTAVLSGAGGATGVGIIAVYGMQ